MRKGMALVYLLILTISITVGIREAISQSKSEEMNHAGDEKGDSGVILPGACMRRVVCALRNPANETRDYRWRQPAQQNASQDSTDSSEVSAPSGRFVVSFGYSRKTYVPAIGASLRHIGVYFPEVSIPFTVMDTDTGSTGFSYTWIAPLTIAVLGEWLAGKVLGVRWLQLAIRYSMLVPVLAINSYHHLVLMGKGGAMEPPRQQLTAFLGSRMDLWDHGSRWTPMAGLQYSVIGPYGNNQDFETGWGLCAGIEAPVDLQSHGKAIPGFFVGLKLYLGGGD